LTLRSTTQETALEEALQFLSANAGRSGRWLPMVRVERTATGERRVLLLDLSWIAEGWWRLVTGERTRGTQPERVDRRHFAVCVFSQLLWDLKAGDLGIVGSDEFADYNRQLVGWAEYDRKIATFGQVAGLPVDGPTFVAQVRGWLEELAAETDRTFPANTAARIEKGEPVIMRTERAPDPERLPELEALLAARMAPLGVLDALTQTAHWLGWTRFFGPISGHEAKLDDPLARYLATVFCYGCQIGPAQLARVREGDDRRQFIWINQRHAT
jgi:hypothetical protein